MKPTAIPALIAESGLITDNGATVQFNTTASSFDMDAKHLSMFSDSQMISSKEEIASSLEELHNMDQDQLHNSQYTRAYRNLADKLAKNLAVDIANLKEVQTEVDEFARRYNYFRSYSINGDPILDKSIAKKDEVLLAIKKYTWQSLEGIDEFVVRNNIHAKINKDIHDILTTDDYNNLLNTLPFAHAYNKIDFHPLELSDEAYERIYTSLCNNTNLSKERAAIALNTLCEFNDRFCKSAITFCADLINDDSSKLDKAMETVYTWSRAIPVLSSQELLDISNGTMRSIMERVNAIRDAVDVLAYICIDYRRNRWNKAILVNGPALNADNLSSFEAIGGKVNDVVKYHNYFYKDLQVPNEGIAADVLLNGLKSVEAKIDTEIADKKLSMEIRLMNIEREAFCAAGAEWIANNSQFFVNMSNTEQGKLLAMISEEEKSLEDKIYSLILNTKFSGSSVIHLYNALSTEYNDHIRMYHSLNAEDVEAINTKVYARIISDKLLDSGLLTVK